ncbi:MAG: hypothetical protein EOO38_28775 [Cytophagaceae bacterium]|nr:MAG: hypothetical protein EOO38_28775 [Cytophagaceae bacterium]
MPAPAHSRGMLRQALATPLVWVFGIAYFFLNFALGAQTWFPQAMHPFHLSKTAETGLIAIPSALASVAMLLWAKRSDRRNERTWHVVVPCAVSALAWYGAARVIADAVWLTALMSLAYCAMYAALVVFWTMPTRFLTATARPAGLAIITALGLPGSMLSLSLGGQLRDSYGSFAPSVMSTDGFGGSYNEERVGSSADSIHGILGDALADSLMPRDGTKLSATQYIAQRNKVKHSRMMYVVFPSRLQLFLLNIFKTHF